LVCLINVMSEAEGVQEQDAEEDIWT
jgi:hypothetical protein